MHGSSVHQFVDVQLVPKNYIIIKHDDKFM